MASVGNRWRYAVLVQANANRVYGRAAPDITVAELAMTDSLVLGGVVQDLRREELGGVDYVTFVTAQPLDDRAASLLSDLSSIHALFRREGDLLAPVTLQRRDRHPDDLVTTQRYVGKTNETFTKLLVNLAFAAAGGEPDGRRFRLLDPLCGRGTTINQAITYGFDVAGIDLDKKDLAAWSTFFLTWMENKRMKHRSAPRGTRTTIEIGDRRAVEQVVETVAAETASVVEHFGRNAFDAIVSDLPYGVQHGARSGGGLARRPATLVEEAMPAWAATLRRGGAMALAFNVRTLPRSRLIESVTAAGLSVLEPVGAATFEHQVDRAITRDVVVARKG